MINLFDYIKGFSPDEPWGDSSKMSGLIVMLMEKVRTVYRDRYDPDASFVLHCGYEADGHVSGSQHYKGNAVDFHIKTKLSFPDQIEAITIILHELQVSNLCGIGIYPDWNSPGFHLDARGVPAQWGRIGTDYVGIDAAFKHAKGREV